MAIDKEIKDIRAKFREELRAVYPTAIYLNRKQLAEHINVSVGHISNLESDKTKKPLVPPSPIGTKVLYSVLDVIDFLVTQEIKKRERVNKVGRGRPTKEVQFSRKAEFQAEFGG
jgi:transcriptional regulator with XRE-family HTH domain